MIEFIYLNIFFFIITIYILTIRLYKSPIIILYLGLVILYVVPANYIYFGGKSYRFFGDDAAHLFYLLGIIQVLFSGILFFVSRPIIKKQPPIQASVKEHKLLTKYFMFFLVSYLFYVIYYWTDWPLFNAIHGNITERPDVKNGVFQFYFSISTLSNIIIPFYFFHYTKYCNAKKTLIFLLAILTVLSLTIGGNKGLFLYFMIFCLLFLNNGKINLKYLVLIPLAGIILYSTMKGTSLSASSISDYLLESIFRRIFITQGISAPNVIQLYLDNVNFEYMDGQEIKRFLFSYVYHEDSGSMPIPYFVEFYIRYGLTISIALSIIITFLLCLAFNLSKTNRVSDYWVIYYACYIIIMSGFSLSNIYRITAAILFLIMINTIHKKYTNNVS